MKNTDYLLQSINWHKTGNALFPYEAAVDGKHLFVRINDFPDENLYTLMIDGEEVLNFDDWSENWDRNAEETAEAIAR